MTSSASHRTLAAGGKRTSFNGMPAPTTAHLLERSKAGLRGSTPDSEALISSDDEPDQRHRLTKVTSNPAPMPARRASWLTESQQNANRKPSIGGAGPFSPVSPSNEHTPWGANVGANAAGPSGRGSSHGTSFPWGNPIWNADTSKGPPQRLTEVMPSPTTIAPTGSAGMYNEEGMASPREVPAEQAFPFAIPLQPTPKTYRSQSYSVGQIDPETSKAQLATTGAANAYSRPRVGSSFAGLQHRPSRPSMLGETSHDPQQLGQLREVDDDDEEEEDDDDDGELSDPENLQSVDQARTIEQLTRENAMLRQAAAENRDRAAASQLNTQSPRQLQFRNRKTSRDTVSESSDPTGYDADDMDGQKAYRADFVNGRRFSEFGVKSAGGNAFGMYPDHRGSDGLKRGQWQSSLGFGGVPEAPQSRRHSFAEVPTRQNSVGAGNEIQKGREIMEYMPPQNGHPVSTEAFPEGATRPSQGEGVSYFSRMDPNLRSPDEMRPPSSTALHPSYMQGAYGRPQQFGTVHHRPKQLLYIVTFKCQRADVFYVQEGTGLQVNKGDLVIVEADRGTDLGTVSSDDVPWAEAKELKDKFIEEHHRWLMMFSQHGQNGTVAGQNPNGAPPNAAMGGAPGQPGMHDVPSGELKPKMIKRVAQQHEVQSLREKEGAEAKAKRACQQKVAEHRLRMEILDAEFQMDWKKLTFFYFADSYINFNPLVTDLFKIYKTRIWMSAINTAAIAPLNNYHLHSGPTHRNYSPEVDEYPRHQPRLQQDSPSVGSPTVVYPGGEHLWNQVQEFGGMPPTSMSHPYAQPAYDMRHAPQIPMGAYNPSARGMPPYLNPAGYGVSLPPRPAQYPNRPDARVPNARDRPETGENWTQSFQRLSLEH